MGDRGNVQSTGVAPQGTTAGVFRQVRGVLSALALLGLAVGCVSPRKQDGDTKPAAKAPDAKPTPAKADKPAAKPAETPGKAPQGPPDNEAGGGGLLGEIARNQSLRAQERMALSNHYTKVGENFYRQGRYQDASDNLRKAVKANPDNTKARLLLQISEVLLGKRPGELAVSAELLGSEREVRIQQSKIELKRLFDQGTELASEKEYERAIRKLEQVLERIKWSKYKIDDGDVETRARDLIVKYRVLKREQELAEREEKERRALSQARSEERAAKLARERKVGILVRRALDELRLDQFSKAEATVREILETDPGNQDALKLRERAIEGRHLERQSTLYETRVEHDRLNTEAQRDALVPYLDEVLFPSKEFWDRVRKRGTGVATRQGEEPNWVKDYKKILRTRKVSINFSDTPFSDVINFLQDVTGLNITVSRDIDTEELRVNLRLREIVLQNAFNLLLEQTDLALTYANETIQIVPKDQVRGTYYLDILDVQDILSKTPDFPGPRITVSGQGGGGGGGGGAGGAGGQTLNFGDDDSESEGAVIDPDRLTELVRGSTGEDNWEDPANIEVHRGQLIIFQTPQMQKQVQTVLESLRRNSGLFVQIETRFITLQNDFLRDIGVDYRDLGTSAPASQVFGTPVELDPSPTARIRSSAVPPQGNPNIIGVGRAFNGRASQFGAVNPVTGRPTFGTSYLGGRLENVIEGTQGGYLAGQRLNGTTVQASAIDKGATIQATFLDPIQVNAILKMDEERARNRLVTAPVVTAANRQRVHISVITQRAYISDYELSSGGTGLVVAEVADPVIETFQEGIVLDVRPTISSDRKYITLDVRPTLAVLVGGDFGRIPVNLGTQTAAAINVNIEVPQVLLQEAFTSVTIPDGGTALLGGFRQINERIFDSGIPFLMELPVINTLFSRKGEIRESSSLMVLIKGKMVSVREEERKLFNTE